MLRFHPFAPTGLPVPHTFEELIPAVAECCRRITQNGKPVRIVNGKNREDAPNIERDRAHRGIYDFRHANEMILCDRPKCEAIADYLEAEADGTEHRLCAFHTTSDKYASRLPTRALNRNTPYRRLQIV